MDYEIDEVDWLSDFYEGKTGVWVDVWWDEEAEIWIIQRKNAHGFQIGDADFAGPKWYAVQVSREISMGYGGVPIRIQNKTYPYAFRQIKI